MSNGDRRVPTAARPSSGSSQRLARPSLGALAYLSLLLALPHVAFGQATARDNTVATESTESTESTEAPGAAVPPDAVAVPTAPAEDTPSAATQVNPPLAQAQAGANEPVDADPVDADGTFKAIWKPQVIDFTYQSFTSLYSCETFRSRIREILVNLGARKDIKVRPRGCEPLSSLGRIGPLSQVLRAQIEVSAPVVATPAALADLEKGKSQRDLLVRARGKRAEDAIETEQFRAGVQRVALSAGSGDCQLVEQLRDQVLPKMGIRILNDDTTCIPGKFGNNEMRLEVEALVAAPRADDASKTGLAPK